MIKSTYISSIATCQFETVLILRNPKHYFFTVEFIFNINSTFPWQSSRIFNICVLFRELSYNVYDKIFIPPLTLCMTPKCLSFWFNVDFMPIFMRQSLGALGRRDFYFRPYHRRPRRCLWFTYVTVLRYVLNHLKECMKMVRKSL